MNKTNTLFTYIKNIEDKLMLMVTSALLLLTTQPIFAYTTPSGLTNLEGTLNGLVTDFTRIITAVLSGIMIICFIWKAFKFAQASDNPAERAKNVQGMIFFFIGAMLFGATFLVTLATQVLV